MRNFDDPEEPKPQPEPASLDGDDSTKPDKPIKPPGAE